MIDALNESMKIKNNFVKDMASAVRAANLDRKDWKRFMRS